jgi:hypothetical protein
LDALLRCPDALVHLRPVEQLEVVLPSDEADVSERDRLRRSLASVYRTRSKVIHGSDITADHQKLADQSDLAIEIAVKAPRVLFRDRPELIGDPERAMAVLLSP